jgi:hypothetical protein
MIKFSCPNCDEALRVPDSRAGDTLRCPECRHKCLIPEIEDELDLEEEEEEPERPAPRKKKRYSEDEPPRDHEEAIQRPPARKRKRYVEEDLPPDDEEEEEPERPAPRKKKRPPARPRSTRELAANRGRILVLVICGVVLGMYLLSLLQFLLTPNPVEMVKKQSREMMQKLGKDMPKDFQQKLDQDFDQVLNSRDLQAEFRRGQIIGLVWLLVSFCVSAALLTCLYLRQNWARIVLAVLFLIGAGLGLLGLLFGGLVALRFLGAGMLILALLEMGVRLLVYTGIGITLLASESIAAYTSER